MKFPYYLKIRDFHGICRSAPDGPSLSFGTMTLILVRISVGISIFLGLLFCGWWTFTMVVEGLSGRGGAQVEGGPGGLPDLSGQVGDELVSEWALPVVVYSLILVLVGAAIAEEVRRLAQYRASRLTLDRDDRR